MRVALAILYAPDARLEEHDLALIRNAVLHELAEEIEVRLHHDAVDVVPGVREHQLFGMRNHFRRHTLVGVEAEHPFRTDIGVVQSVVELCRVIGERVRDHVRAALFCFLYGLIPAAAVDDDRAGGKPLDGIKAGGDVLFLVLRQDHRGQIRHARPPRPEPGP